ncbi:MAG: hypothetical protein JWO12_1517 [Frankiales bacterium]|nr:hypothetical protein [Frankiales bacterium]
MTRPDDEQARRAASGRPAGGRRPRPAGTGAAGSSGGGRGSGPAGSGSAGSGSAGYGSAGSGRSSGGARSNAELRRGRPSGTEGGRTGAPRSVGAGGQQRDGQAREWTYDPRREARRQMARVPLPDDVSARDLDREVQKELKGLAAETAEVVAKHLVMAGRLLDDEPEKALAHARAARALAGRVAAVREANGLVAYTAGEWSEALSELRTARRLSGDPEHLAVMADCERALGRPDRALLVTEDPQAKSLSAAARVELLIVAAGARRDMGQFDAAVVALQVGALEGPVRPWTVRLRYAYADALLHAGREDEARQWFARTLDVDEQGETDAQERLMELDGVVFEDLDEAEDDPSAEVVSAADLSAMVADMSTPRPDGVPELTDAAAESLSGAERASTTAAPAGPTTTPSGPAFSSEPEPAVEAVRSPISAPTFRSAAKTNEDDAPEELRLFD